VALPQPIIDFINESADRAGAKHPGNSDDLFKLGVLDSFALIDFVTLLDEHGIKVPDADVVPANFQSIDVIERYVQAHQG